MNHQPLHELTVVSAFTRRRLSPRCELAGPVAAAAAAAATAAAAAAAAAAAMVVAVAVAAAAAAKVATAEAEGEGCLGGRCSRWRTTA